MKLTSTVAESLSQSLPELSALRTLEVSDLVKCSDDAVTKLVTAIKHKTLEELKLSEVNLTSEAAVALGQSLSELPSLQNLTISGSDGCSLQLEFLVFRELEIRGVTELSAAAVTRLIDVMKHKLLEKLERSEVHCPTSAIAKALGQLLPKLSALQTLKISGLAECPNEALTKLVTAAINHKALKELDLCEINLTSRIAESLAQSLPKLSALQTLTISGLNECSDEAVTILVSAIKHKTLKELKLSEMNLTSAAVVALGQSLPELPSLQKLEISGSDGCSLQLEFPVVRELKIQRWPEFSAEAVTRLIDVIKHKHLEKLVLSEIHLTSAVAEALGQLLPELSALQTLKISGLAQCSDDVVTKLVTSIKHKTLEKLTLCEMNLTSTIAESLAQSLPELTALRTLKLSGLIKCSNEVATRLGAIIKHKTLEKLDLSEIHLTSAVAESLGQSLPELSALRTLKVSGLIECSDNAVTRLVAAIKHKTLEDLKLSEMNLTSAAVVALGQSLPELPSLQKLEISGSDGCSLQLEFPVVRELKIQRWPEFSAEAVTRLIDVIKREPVEILEVSEIHLTSSVAEGFGQLLPELSALQRLKINDLTNTSDEAGTRFFAAFKHKTLKELDLNKINVTSAATEALAQSVPELSALQTLKIVGLTECSDEAVTKLVAAIKHKTLVRLELSEINLASVAAEALGQSLPELSALRTLKISGLSECSDEAVTKLVAAIKHKTLEKLKLSEIDLASVAAEALGQSLPELSALRTLKISGLTECSDEAVTKLVAAIKHKTLEKLELSVINLASVAAESLGQSLPELSALRTLKISGLSECSDEAVTKLVAAINHRTLEKLELSDIKLASVAAEALGQSLPELLALRTLKISNGCYVCRLQHKEVEALFGRFNSPSFIEELCFTGFTARGSLAPLANNLCFFRHLLTLNLEDLDMDAADLFGLLKNLKFTPDLQRLSLNDNQLGHAVRSMIPYLLKHQELKVVCFRPGDCSEEDLKYVQEAVKEKRPHLKIETSWW